MADDPTHLDNMKVLRDVLIARRREIAGELIRYRASMKSPGNPTPSAGHIYGKQIADLQSELLAVEAAISDELHALSRDVPEEPRAFAMATPQTPRRSDLA